MQRKAQRHKMKMELALTWSEWRTMWTIVFFDLPVITKEQRHDYAQFRRGLIELGYTKLQYSVYARHLATDERAKHFFKAIETMLPPEGQVRILTVTGKQFENQIIFEKTRRKPPENEPIQLELF